MRVTILGVSIDAVTADDVRERVLEFLTGQGSHVIVTPNPEFLVAAQSNTEFKEQLNRADLAIPDGIGLLLAARILRQPLRTRVTGVETVEMIAEIAAHAGRSLFLLGGKEGVAKGAGEELVKRHPRLKVVGAESGGTVVMEHGTWNTEQRGLTERMSNVQPDILLVAFGHVKQELWIRDHLHLFPSVKIVMGVGGTFDYLAGVERKPPQWMRAMGLEWLWRLVTQPRRVGRIYNATFRFLSLVIKERLNSKQ